MRAAAVLPFLHLLILGAVAIQENDDLFGEEEDDFFDDDNGDDDDDGDGDGDDDEEDPIRLKEKPKLDSHVLQGNRRDMQVKVKLPEIDPKAAACPRGFVYDSTPGYCFKVIDDHSGSIKAGTKLCAKLARGGRLVQLNTKGKFDAVTKYIMSRPEVSSKSFIVGAGASVSKPTSRTQYYWLSLERMQPNNWCPGSPDTKKTCIRLVKKEGYGMCFDDACCIRPKFFICEKPIN